MKKDINFIFFGLLLLLLVAMVGVMLYSDYTYQKVNVQYIEFKTMYDEAQEELNNKTAQLEEKDAALREKEDALLDIINELNLSKQKETSLSGYYESVKTEKDELESDLDALESERDRWKSNYDSKSLELGRCQTDYALSQKSLSRMEGNIILSQATLLEAVNVSEELNNDIYDLDCADPAVCSDSKEVLKKWISSLQGKLQTIKGQLDAA